MDEIISEVQENRKAEDLETVAYSLFRWHNDIGEMKDLELELNNYGSLVPDQKLNSFVISVKPNVDSFVIVKLSAKTPRELTHTVNSDLYWKNSEVIYERMQVWLYNNTLYNQFGENLN